MKTSRGFRNNNPTNIVRSSTTWEGMKTRQEDPVFVQFTSMEYGVRAAFVLLRTYISKYNVKKVKDIIRRWCPDETADNYIKQVCKMTDSEPDTIVDWRNQEQMCALVAAMIFVENGQLAQPDDISTGWLLFFRDYRHKI